MAPVEVPSRCGIAATLKKAGLRWQLRRYILFHWPLLFRIGERRKTNGLIFDF